MMQRLFVLVLTIFVLGRHAHAEDSASPPLDPKIFREQKFAYTVEKSATGSAVLVSRNLRDQAVERIPLTAVKKGTSYFHWTDNTKGLQDWTTRGSVSLAEMNGRIASGNGLAGGGLYTSLSGTDSIRYGHKVAVFTAPRDLFVLPPNKWESLRESWKEQLPDEDEPGTDMGWTHVAAREMNRALAKAGVAGAYAGTSNSNTWLAWFDPAGVSKVREAHYDDIVAAPFASKDFEDAFLFEERFAGRKNPLIAKHPLLQKIVARTPLTDAEKKSLSHDIQNLDRDALFRKTDLFKQVQGALGHKIEKSASEDTHAPSATK